MAWRCSSNTNVGLISNLKDANIIQTSLVFETMKKVDRLNYAPGPDVAYEDSPAPIGHAATISAPHMHAHALEILAPALNEVKAPKILDVGCGSGYLVTCFARMVQLNAVAQAQGNTSKANITNLVNDGAKVVGIDYLEPLVQLSDRNIRK